MNVKRRQKIWKLSTVAAIALIAAACSSPEEKVEKYYASGQEFLQNEDYGKANVQFQNVLKINEEHIPALVGMAQIAENQQDLERMFGLYQKIVRLDPNHVHANTQLGKLYLIGSDETAAMEYAEAALAIDPNSLDAKALKSGVLLRVGDKENAVKIAREVVRVAPTNPEATTVLATAKAMDEDYEGALAELERAIAIDPKVAVLQLLRIQLLSQIGREDDVMAGFANLVELFPEEPIYRRAYASELVKRERLAEAQSQLEEAASLMPESVAAKLDVVRVANVASGVGAAEKVLRDYLADDPKNIELQFALVDFLAEQESLDEALEYLEPLKKSDDLSVATQAKNKAASLLFLNGDTDAGTAMVEEILEEDQNNTAALIKRAGLYIDSENYDSAIADLRTALNNDPDSIDAMLLMAAAFEQQGNNDFARAELAKAFEASDQSARVAKRFAQFLVRTENYARAEEVLEEGLAKKQRDATMLKMLAAVRLQQQDWRGAEEAAAILSEIGEGDDTDVAQNIRTVALSGLQQYDEIIDLLSSEQQQAPLESRPLATLINAYVEAERLEEAKTLLESVIASDADHYQAYIHLARVESLMGDVPEGERLLLQAVEIDPGATAAYELLYRYYLGTGRSADATTLINGGLENAPESDALQFFKADILLTTGDRASAFELYKGLIERRPDDRIIANNYVSLSSDLQQDEASIAAALEIAQVLKDDPNPLIQDTVGWAYYRAGQYEEAVEYLSKASSALETNSEILYHLGAAQIAAGDVETGKETLQQAVEIGGEAFRYADQVSALMEQN